MNALVMYDHQSETVWSQFLSRGVKGPQVNQALEIVPAVQTTWQQWLSLHPDTLVLDKRGRYQGDTYEGYYRGGSAGILGESNKDKRLPGKELVMGMGWPRPPLQRHRGAQRDQRPFRGFGGCGDLRAPVRKRRGVPTPSGG